VPFINKNYSLSEPLPAFLFLMRTLGVRQGEAQKIVATKRLRVNGQTVEDSGEKIVGEIEVLQFVPSPTGKKPLFETPDFALFEKPSGVLVHPTTYRTPYSMLDEIRHLYGPDANAVHRIDMETSGLLLASRNKPAEKRLKTLFERRGVHKAYLAWVRGKLEKDMQIDAPLRQNEDFSTIKLKMLIDPTGKPASTLIKPLRYDMDHDATLVEAIPLTGRQHQIRVHLFHVKHPILGDPIYGVPTSIAIKYLDKILTNEERIYYMGAPRLLLHAYKLEFSDNGVDYKFISEVDFESHKKLIASPKKRCCVDSASS